MKKNNYVIVSDSACDLPFSYVEKHNITILPLKFYFGDKKYYNYLNFPDISGEEFFDRLRKKEFAKTSQVNIDEFKVEFEKILKEEKDILVVTLSSGLSGTHNSAEIARGEMLEKYPNRKILIVDSLGGSLGEGMVVDKAVKLKNEGLSIEENHKALEEFRFHVAHLFTHDDLIYLKEGGRIGSIAYHIGATLRIKPIITADNDGKLKLRHNAFGRKKSINMLIKRTINTFDKTYGDEIFISHADSIDEATKVKEELEANLDAKVTIVHMMGPVIGAHGGPGTIAVFYPIKER